MTAAMEYFMELKKLIGKISEQAEAIDQAAEIIKDVYSKGGIVHLFGAGHSHIPTQEVMVRAGCLTFANSIWHDGTMDIFERVPGVGMCLLSKQDLRSGEVIFVFSNSGVNPLPVEVAQEAKGLGLKVVAVTSMDHSARTRPLTKDGKRLYDVADLVLDNCAPYGDAVLSLPDSEVKYAPVSTIGFVAIINAVFAEAAVKIAAAGLDLPIRVSRNIPGGDAHNKKFIAKYADRIPDLRY